MNPKMIVLLVVAALPACGGDGGPAPPTSLPPASSFSVSVTPTPLVAVDCTPAVCSSTPGAQYAVIAGLTVTESGGVGGTVNSITLTFRTPDNMELGTLTIAAGDIIDIAGTNRVNGRGTLIVRGIGAAYRLSDGSRQGTLTFTVAITDDRGTFTTQSVAVPVV